MTPFSGATILVLAMDTLTGLLSSRMACTLSQVARSMIPSCSPGYQERRDLVLALHLQGISSQEISNLAGVTTIVDTNGRHQL